MSLSIDDSERMDCTPASRRMCLKREFKFCLFVKLRKTGEVELRSIGVALRGAWAGLGFGCSGAGAGALLPPKHHLDFRS